jgi:hypothetical protein
LKPQLGIKATGEKGFEKNRGVFVGVVAIQTDPDNILQVPGDRSYAPFRRKLTP